MSSVEEAIQTARNDLLTAAALASEEFPEVACLLGQMARGLEKCKRAPTLTESQARVVEETLWGPFRETNIHIARRESEIEDECKMMGEDNDRVQGGESTPFALRVVQRKEADKILNRLKSEVEYLNEAVALMDPWQRDFIDRYYVQRQAKEEIMAEYSMSLPTFYRRRREVIEPLMPVVFAGFIKI